MAIIAPFFAISPFGVLFISGVSTRKENICWERKVDTGWVFFLSKKCVEGTSLSEWWVRWGATVQVQDWLGYILYCCFPIIRTRTGWTVYTPFKKNLRSNSRHVGKNFLIIADYFPAQFECKFCLWRNLLTVSTVPHKSYMCFKNLEVLGEVGGLFAYVELAQNLSSATEPIFSFVHTFFLALIGPGWKNFLQDHILL